MTLNLGHRRPSRPQRLWGSVDLPLPRELRRGGKDSTTCGPQGKYGLESNPHLRCSNQGGPRVAAKISLLFTGIPPVSEVVQAEHFPQNDRVCQGSFAPPHGPPLSPTLHPSSSTRPAAPSTRTSWPLRKRVRDSLTDMTAGMPISRAVTAPCESGPPLSVTTAAAL